MIYISKPYVGRVCGTGHPNLFMHQTRMVKNRVGRSRILSIILSDRTWSTKWSRPMTDGSLFFLTYWSNYLPKAKWRKASRRVYESISNMFLNLKAISAIAPILNIYSHVLFNFRLISRLTRQLRFLATQYRCYSLKQYRLNRLLSTGISANENLSGMHLRKGVST